ncbi:MAG: outer membrane protein transport protein [Desulfobulbaceae bacterium]|nr:outer membrane protein transport protein [Desulfobulbaceae bacterium]
MKKKILAVAAMGIMAAGTAHASGYRIPEQSINGVALSNAYIAHTEGPDTAYYNPANMGWQEDRWQMEVSASYINLPHIDYTDYRSSTLDGSSQTENIVVPMFHAVSPDYNNFRFGFAFVVPYGLSKRWNDPFPRTSSEEFTLKVFEANPSLSYKFCDWFGLAAGARILHTTGNKVKSSGYIDIDPGPGLTYASISRDMDGDSTDLGYNLAMTIKPTKEWNIAATYRSEVDMGLTGSARLLTDTLPFNTYNGDARLDVVTPAVLSIGTSYTFFDRTTVELAWDKTYWSEYSELDFNYNGTLLNPLLIMAFDDPKAKNWHDSNAYRIGITHKCTDRFTAMIGFAYDETPIPSETLGFELPDSDALLFSFGGRYQVNEHLELGGAYLLDHKNTRTIENPANTSGINGKFEDAGAHVVTLGLVYKF